MAEPRADRYAPPAGAALLPPAPATIDLHTHTTRSDGLLEPVELVRQAAAAGIRLLAITDHDSVTGIRDIRAALPPGLELIAGVEVNAVTATDRERDGGELHILGLGVDADDEPFEALLARQREGRRIRFHQMVARLAAAGIDLPAALDALPPPADDDSLGRPRIARAMISIGAATSIDDAFERWLSPGRPGYVARVGLGPVDAIRAIRAAGGLASLAHFAEAPSKTPLLEELKAEGLGGLEVHHRSFDEPTVAAMAAVAVSLRLVPTGGSDYHGDHGPYAESHAGLWVPNEIEAGVRAALQSTANDR